MNAVVYGVNPGLAESHARFARRLALPYRLLVDQGGRIAREYRCGFWRIVRRTVYLVGTDGRVAAGWRGAPAVEIILGRLRAMK